MYPRLDDLGLCRVDENTHQRRSKHTDQTADNNAKYRRHRSGAADALADTLRLMRPVVLRHKGGERIAKVLHRQIGKRVDLYRRRKCRHGHRPKAIYQALHHQDAKVHNGLLHAGHHRQIQNGGKRCPIPAAVLPAGAQLREAPPGIHRNADAGDKLCCHCGQRSPFHPPAQAHNTAQVQHHIQYSGYRQKHQRYHGIADRTQQAGIIIIKEGGQNAQENHRQVILHQGADLRRDTQDPQDPVHPQIHRTIQHQREHRDQPKGQKDTAAQPVLLARTILHGDGCTAAHA